MGRMSTGLGHYEKRADAPPSLPDTPLAVSPREAARLLSLGVSRVYQLMRAGELQNYEDGRARRILMTSVHDYVARRLADSAGKWEPWQHNPRAIAKRIAAKNTDAPTRRRKQVSRPATPPKRRARANQQLPAE
jgi:excisionase family DNA binding protein